MYTITLLAVSAGQAKSQVSPDGVRFPANQAAGTQVGQPGRWDAGRPSAGMGYYPRYPSLRLGRCHAFIRSSTLNHPFTHCLSRSPAPRFSPAINARQVNALIRLFLLKDSE